ncbi:oligosaccharide flippase family protein [Modestobacter sp. VKM Ac-2983]|uniref:lipopolysaccharide biosynthesis protein n=1 Tax=Modestobacter sp. VKM Ac-2983 TaxID=3004137 RepID=UPI0022AB8333|nr:oligosaccharide flippase family protein [Modestobacter sp. VKM Ac-2983]MCZ2804098.1 oligosaccharide flippase family protein [Modestobacter sp. VKM Ac-2983]
MSQLQTPEPRPQLTAAAARPDETGDERSVWAGIVRSGGTRLLVLPVSALLGIVVTRLVIDNYGEAAFAQYGLLVGLGALLPFADLGMSAAVMNAVAAARAPGSDDHVRAVLLTAVRVLIGSAAVLSTVAVAVTLLGLWPALLGPALLPDTGPLAAMGCLLLLALAMPMGIGQRVLSGLGRNHVSIALFGLQTPLVLLVLVGFLWLGVPAGSAMAVVPYGTTFVLAVVCTIVAVRAIRPAARDVLRRVRHVRTQHGARVFDVAWPMLVQMIALPIAMQTDRIVLSHRAGVGELAEYNLAAQMFLPIWAVVSSAGVTLWPVFARARARGIRRSPLPMAWAFGGLAAGMAALVAAASPFLADLASGGRIELGGLLVGSFAVLMVLQGAKYPLGMFMTDARGLRFQALMIVAMLPLNVGLSWWLAGPLGAAGPVLGSIAGVAASQVLGNLLYVRRTLRAAERDAATVRPAHEAAAAADGPERVPAPDEEARSR